MTMTETTTAKVAREGRVVELTILVLMISVAFTVGVIVGMATAKPSGGTLPSSAQAKGVTIVASQKEPTRIPLPNGDVLVVPAGQKATVRIEQIGEGDKTATAHLEERGASSSAGAKATGDKISGDFRAESPEVNMGEDFFARGGGTKYKFELVSSSGISILMIVGALLIVAGIVVWIWLKQATIGLALVVSGVVLIGVSVVADKYPWVFALAGVVVLAVIVVILYQSYKAKKSTDAGTAAIKGIDQLTKIEPKDLPLTILAPVAGATAADQIMFAQQVINATYEVLKQKLQAASEKVGGALAPLVAKVK